MLSTAGRKLSSGSPETTCPQRAAGATPHTGRQARERALLNGPDGEPPPARSRSYAPCDTCEDPATSNNTRGIRLSYLTNRLRRSVGDARKCKLLLTFGKIRGQAAPSPPQAGRPASAPAAANTTFLGNHGALPRNAVPDRIGVLTLWRPSRTAKVTPVVAGRGDSHSGWSPGCVRVPLFSIQSFEAAHLWPTAAWVKRRD